MPDIDERDHPLSLSDLRSFTIQSLAPLIAFFQALWRTFLKNIWLLLFTSATVGGGYYFYATQKPKQWIVKMSCIYNDNHPRVFGEMIQQLNFYASAKDYRQLSSLLKLDEQNCKHLTSIEGKNISMGKLEEDYSKNKEPFYIFMTLKELSAYNNLENALITYLNNNAYSSRQRAKQIEKWNNRLSFYHKEIAKLDSLKEAIRTSYLSDCPKPFLTASDNSIVSIYKLSDSLSNFSEDYQYYVSHYKSVEILNSFIIVSSPSRSLTVNSLKVAIIFMASALFILAVRGLFQSNF